MRPVNNKMLITLGLVAVAAVGGGLYLRSQQQTQAPALAPLPPVLVASQPESKTAVTPRDPNDPSTQVLELFNPSDTALNNQLNETAISQQIEQILSTSFVLTTCNIISSDDYRNSFIAAIAYAERMKLAPNATAAEARVRQIAESAGASYSLIYSRTKCDSAPLPGIAKQLLAWQEAYLPKP